jgi:predicted RNA methylase
MISQTVKDILTNSIAYNGNSVKLTCGQLERSVYEDVNEVFRRLQGKWKGGKVSAHQFPFDPKPLIDAIIESGQLPPDNPYALFPTPKHVVDDILDRADLDWRANLPEDYSPNPLYVLEPSAGLGAFADAIKATLHAVDTLHCVEIDPFLAGMLKSKGHTVFEQDFTTYQTDVVYDLVIMNPPFSVDTDKLAYITHIMHAWSMLRNGGTLIAIIPPSWVYNQSKKIAQFREFVSKYGQNVWTLERNTFKDSGTTIETHVIELRNAEKSADHEFWTATLYMSSQDMWNDALKQDKSTLKEWMYNVLWKEAIKSGDFIHIPSIDIDKFYNWLHES